MEMLGQINLLNLTTNKIQGVRLKNAPDFNDLAKQSENFRIYYIVKNSLFLDLLRFVFDYKYIV
jgi:hypothetical protein